MNIFESEYGCAAFKKLVSKGVRVKAWQFSRERRYFLAEQQIFKIERGHK